MPSSRRLPAATEERRRKHRKNDVAFALVLSIAVAFVLLSLLVHSLANEKPLEGEKSSAIPPNNCYKMRVYVLNYTQRESASDRTIFRFDSQELPFEFGSLIFGDFTKDTEYSSSYYAGMVLLASAEGPNGTVTFREGSGTLILETAYQGQSLIALGAWESISIDADGSVIDHSWGSMAIPAHDWRNGSWVPESGILIEHPANMTISGAAIHLMVFEPASITDVPEFGQLALPIVAGFMIATMIVAAHARRNGGCSGPRSTAGPAPLRTRRTLLREKAPS